MSKYEPARVLMGNSPHDKSNYYEVVNVIEMVPVPGEDVNGFEDHNNIAIVEKDGSIGMTFLPNDYGQGKFDSPFTIWAGCTKDELTESLEVLHLRLKYGDD